MVGASKLRKGGIDWWEPDHMRRILVTGTLSAMN